MRPGVHGCVDGSQRAKVRPQPQAAQARPRTPATPPPPNTSLRTPPDAKSALRTQRHQLLIEEIAQLESVLAKTPKTSPDRPVLLRRIAEGYAELAATNELRRDRAELEANRATEAERATAKQRTRSKPAPKPPEPARVPGDGTVL